ncbi:peptidoglycan -binding protein [Blastochloris viridis]|uniref:Flagellar motor rotation protein MotB n=1 Tax=Blastochloris viridis TaxID=1079 RepID=A0A0H5BP34_BLAVI|nr:peptidoglycan -binding protein [Blastochloris viridis]ALK08047.1 putative lipoprotein YiaD precursor [Blastochloris viridis]BAR98693.1 flagellar motor rotation protein MotB [Blastochloris viridis]CUU43969.1 Inner membrane lipoprotein YiaD precursor [Blastochloris viridis]
MALGRGRRRERAIDYWPGFVDALSTLILVFVFLLTVFVLAQYVLTQQIAGKETALGRLTAQIRQLTDLLSLERGSKAAIDEQLTVLQETLRTSEAERRRMQGLLDGQGAGGSAAAIEAERQLSRQQLSQIELLNQQTAALRRQIAALEEALGAAEARDLGSQTKIGDLGRRLNVALAQRVQELARYRSEFFGRLRESLGNRPDVRIVGDRFVLQSEVFFDAGSAQLRAEGRGELDKLAGLVAEFERTIPTDLAWVLRVDGHTDRRPIATAPFPSNWELSAARAISVVQYLIARGLSPQRLVAAGFGEFQPLDPADGEDAFRRNRRIELKLTER